MGAASIKLLPRVLVTGAGGQLATAMVDGLAATADVLALPHALLDITDCDAVEHQVAAFKPQAIINCAAFNDVDGAEDEAVRALHINALALRTLARAARSIGATLVHYSTDFVFDGRSSTPYVEEDQPNPQHVYGASKLLGEWFAAEAPRAFVLRVESLFGGRIATSSVDRIIDAIVDGREARVFADRTVSPSYVVDVVDATRRLLDRGDAGLYHCVGSGYCTWYELAQEIARQLGRAATLVPVLLKDVDLTVPRPPFSALSNAKLARAGVAMPSWQDALRRHLRVRMEVSSEADRAAP
jgi:dTDP-4-dehydrorhamnose reductase